MSDDLVKRLWESDEASALTNEAARRIEALHVERDENEGVIKVWRRRCQEAEAERDAAVLALSDIGSPNFIRPIVEEQSCGEWGDDIVDADTAKICAAIRARSKLE